MLGLFARRRREHHAPTRSRPSTPRCPVEHEIHTYEGAPHSFFDRRQEDYKDESQDAWTRILGFIERL